jgi:DNA-binding LacI/PurR family transcriptional regulator
MMLVCFMNQIANEAKTEVVEVTPLEGLLPQRNSLVTQTVQCLIRAIEGGHWRDFLPGERELAAWLQVSRLTLRSALESLEKGGMVATAERRRRRIVWQGKREPEKGGKVVNVLSDRPLEGMTQAAVIMVDHLRAELSRKGMELHLHVSVACYSAQPGRALEGLVRRAPAAVWLLVGSMAPMQRWFAQRGLPCLVLGTSVAGIGLPSIDADHRAACRHAGHLLLRKGHRRIALVRPAKPTGGEADTEAGLREALQGESAAQLKVIRHDGSPAQLVALLDQAMQGKQAPTAYVVARAVHVLTVLMHLQRCGKRVPDEVAVICRDDEPFLHHAVPAITRYATSARTFARRVFQAVRQLAEEGGMATPPKQITPSLIRGETV